MFTLPGPVQESNATIEIKVGEQGFQLTLRPVTDDEKTRDSALFQRFAAEQDPAKATDFFLARNALRASCVIGWEGVLDSDGKPVKFTQERFKSIMSYSDIRAQIIGPVNQHFEKRLETATLGEFKGRPSGSIPDAPLRTSPKSSDGTPGESQQGG